VWGEISVTVLPLAARLARDDQAVAGAPSCTNSGAGGVNADTVSTS